MNKRLRFIVADTQHSTRLHIEKLLNALGCYGIVPVGTFDEVAVLSHCSDDTFDGLIINSALLPGNLLLPEMGLGTVRSTLVYQYKARCSTYVHWREPRVCLRVCGLPERDLLAHWLRK